MKKALLIITNYLITTSILLLTLKLTNAVSLDWRGISACLYFVIGTSVVALIIS